jgi:hypothetical protein
MSDRHRIKRRITSVENQIVSLQETLLEINDEFTEGGYVEQVQALIVLITSMTFLRESISRLNSSI